MKAAQEVLARNWRGHYTVPSPTLYPHQWSWDSAFIAIGYAHYAPDRARSELDSLFRGQWSNGLIPHIIFDTSVKGYSPGPELWGTEDLAPKGVATSGIVQPPVHAVAALRYYRHTRDVATIRRWFPRLKAYHRYLHEDRDPERSGFATIYHPWESGLDNSPRWDEPLARVEPKGLPAYRRSDTTHSSAEERPTDLEYDRYIYLVGVLKRHSYDDRRLYSVVPFKVKDVVFNTILYVANRALLELARVLGEDTGEIEGWVGRQEERFTRQFCPDPDEGLFYDYDLVAGRFIRRRTVANLIPIYTGIADPDIIAMTVRWMDHAHWCGKADCRYPMVPSTSLDSPHFAHITYWRGPIWVNTNWMLYQGLKRYGYVEKAEILRDAILRIVRDNGFYEFYDPHNGKGYGARDFSWTASLTIDLLHRCRVPE